MPPTRSWGGGRDVHSRGGRARHTRRQVATPRPRRGGGCVAAGLASEQPLQLHPPTGERKVALLSLCRDSLTR